MGLEKVVEVADISVKIRELTVKEVRSWLINAGDDKDIVGQLLLDDCTLNDLSIMSSLTAGKAEKLTPSELEEIKEGCKAVNPHFFNLRMLIMERHPLVKEPQLKG